MRFARAYLLPMGRISRWEFWLMGLIIAGLAWLPILKLQSMIVAGAAPTGTVTNPAADVQTFMGLYAIYVIGGTYLYVVATVNRLHDLGKSGWRILFPFAPWIALIYLFGASIAGRIDLLPDRQTMTIVFYVLMGIGLLSTVLLFIECAFWRGDTWANKYGRAPGER